MCRSRSVFDTPEDDDGSVLDEVSERKLPSLPSRALPGQKLRCNGEPLKDAAFRCDRMHGHAAAKGETARAVRARRKPDAARCVRQGDVRAGLTRRRACARVSGARRTACRTRPHALRRTSERSNTSMRVPCQRGGNVSSLQRWSRAGSPASSRREPTYPGSQRACVCPPSDLTCTRHTYGHHRGSHLARESRLKPCVLAWPCGPARRLPAPALTS
jgi:hypothetical protein